MMGLIKKQGDRLGEKSFIFPNMSPLYDITIFYFCIRKRLYFILFPLCHSECNEES